MKKLLVLLLIISPLFGFSQFAEVPLEGNFNGQRCNGAVGLCTITHIENGLNNENSRFKAKKIDESHFQLIIERTKISKEEELRIVGEELSSLSTNTKFVVEDDFILDKEILEQLGLNSIYIKIPKGEYPISIDSARAYINFKVEKL